MTKDEYLYALASVKMDGDYCDEKKYSILQKLIEEHFEKRNTDEFKHFKQFSDATLKSMKKDDLIDYIHVLLHNWEVTDESYKNVMEHVRKLQKE